MNENNKFETLIEEIVTKEGNWGNRKDNFIDTIKDICKHYSDELGYSKYEILQALEEKREYSYPNYYQWANFPKLDTVVKFKNKEEMIEKIKPEKGFCCPACNGKSTDPYVCNSGLDMTKNKTCDWKAYGLLGTLSEGLRIIIIADWLISPIVHEIFMPLNYIEKGEIK